MDTQAASRAYNHRSLDTFQDMAETERLIKRTGLGGRELGRLGEEYVCLWLQNQGWRILARNWHCRFGELDIVALDPFRILVFVEVKTRRTTTFGSACEAVGQAKRQRLRRAAVQWLIGHDRDPFIRRRGTRFDVVTLTVGGRMPTSGLPPDTETPDSDMRIPTITNDLPRRPRESGQGWSPDSIFLRHIREAF